MISSFPSLPVLSGPSVVPSVGLSWYAAASSLSFFRASVNHPFRFSALITEGPPEQ